MSLPSTLSNTVMTGNSFDQGFTRLTSSTTTNYSYSSLILTNADCNIFGNNFAGVTSSSSNVMINLVANSSCNIKHNKFAREANILSSYISNSSSNDHLIVNNIFDGYTSDGSNENLVTGLTGTSIYDKNKNQIGYAAIQLTELGPAIVLPTSLKYGQDIYSNDTSTIIQIPSSDTSNEAVSFSGVINDLVPLGVKLLYAVVGMISNNSAAVYSGNDNFFLFHIQCSTIPIQFSAPTFINTLADIRNYSASTAISSNTLTLNNGNAFTFTTTTQYMSANLSPSNITVNNNFDITAVFFAFMHLSSSTAGVSFSPLIIKYIW